MKKYIVVLFTLFLVLGLHAQESFNLKGAGARALGMGGAFIAVCDDATASSWNPAGLTQLKSPEAAFSCLFNKTKYEYDVEDFEETDMSHFAFNFGSLAMPLVVAEKNLVVAIAYQRHIDLYFKDEYEWAEGSDYDEYTEETTGGIDAISPAVGIQLTDQIAAGITFNLWRGGPKTEKDEEIHYDYAFYDGWLVDDYNYTYEGESEMKFPGFNAILGVLVDFPQVKIGGIIRTPVTFSREKDSTYSWNESFYYLGTLYEGSGDDTGAWESELKFPMMMGIGIAAQPTPNLTIAFDYDMRPYSKAEKQYTVTGEYYDPEWEDCNEIRLGMEYLFIGPNSVFPVRFGYRTDPKFYTDAEDEQVVGRVFSFGAGLVMGNFMIDGALEYGSATADWGVVEETETSLNFIISAVAHF